MDRRTFYRDQVPTEGDIMLTERYAYEGLGLLALDILGSTTAFAGLACNPTSPASLQVSIAPGRIYSKQPLEANDWGKISGTGGLNSDTVADHYILKQGLARDTQLFTITPPATAGQSQVYLIQAQFQETDAAATAITQYNVDNPNAPITTDLSPDRQNKCLLSLKAGVAAATGAQTEPAPDAGWIPVWAITVANGQTAITAGDIAAATDAPQINIGSGSGSGSGLRNWQTISSAYAAVDKDRLICDTSGGGFNITLPANPVADVTEIWIKGNFAAHNVTVLGNGHGWSGFADPLVLNKDYLNIVITFDGANWRI